MPPDHCRWPCLAGLIRLHCEVSSRSRSYAKSLTAAHRPQNAVQCMRREACACHEAGFWRVWPCQEAHLQRQACPACCAASQDDGRPVTGQAELRLAHLGQQWHWPQARQVSLGFWPPSAQGTHPEIAASSGIRDLKRPPAGVVENLQAQVGRQAGSHKPHLSVHCQDPVVS